MVSYPSVARITKKVKLTDSIDGPPKPGQLRKLNLVARDFIKAEMRKNDEASSRQIQNKLSKHGVEVHP